MRIKIQSVSVFIMALSVIVFGVSLSPCHAQGTAFTYQGRLNAGGTPANGLYDFRFRLDADTAGNTILSTVVTNAIGVTNGLFITTIDFGAGWFNGSNYWLEVDVKTNNFAGYTSLNPFQPFTPAPYAVFAGSASNLVGTLPAAQLSGPVNSANLSGTYGNAVTLNNAGNSFSGSFAGNGGSVSNVNAAAIDGLNATNFWQTGGNNVAGGQFFGSTNNQAVVFLVNNLRALRIEPGGVSSNAIAQGFSNPNGAPNFIGGSPNNFVSNGVVGATVGGGGATNYLGVPSTNSVMADFGTVGGGSGNLAGGFAATIAGGDTGTANGDHATVGGGWVNVANGILSTVGGGNGNGSTGDYSTVGGGNYNTSSGQFSTVPGGIYNLASGDRSFAAGANARATNTGAFVWADSQATVFGSTAANQFNVRASGGVRLVTSGAGMTLDGQPVLTQSVITNNQAGIFTASTVAVTNQLRLNDRPLLLRTGGDGNHGLAYNGLTVTNFGTGNVQVDGPVLWGFTGGALGVENGGAHAVLSWSNGGVNVNGTISGDGSGLTNLTAAQLPAAAVTNNENGVTLHNATFSGTVSFPGTVTINDGGGKYLYSDGVGNFFLGQGAGNPAVSGFNNVSLGENTLSAVTSGGNNTGLGYTALAFNTQGNNNVAVGFGALYNNTNGVANTASGYETLYNNTSGSTNTAVGNVALFSNTSGEGNTAIGESALNGNTNGSYNTAVGLAALASNRNGLNNTAIGCNALAGNRNGSNNIAIGYNAGFAPTGSSNIDIGNIGFVGEGNTIRIGTSQTATFVAGISGATAASGVAVYVNSSGQLGTLTSSSRFKRDIKPMDEASDAILALRPVTFKYKPELDAKGLPQFGLIAEEVDKVDPDLVARDDKNQIYTVRYEAVNAMLLNEFLKEHKTVETQGTEIQQLKQNIEALKSMVEKMAETSERNEEGGEPKKEVYRK